MNVKHIAFTAYPARDVATARRWYEEKLGLRFAGPYIEDGVEKYNEAHLGDGCFSLMSAEWTAAPGSAASIAFEVDDIETTVALLAQQGVTIEEHFDGPVCRSIAVRDLDGNKVTLHQSTR